VCPFFSHSPPIFLFLSPGFVLFPFHFAFFIFLFSSYLALLFLLILRSSGSLQSVDTHKQTHTHTHTHTNAYNNTYSNSFLLHTEKTGAYIAPIENVLLPVYERRGLV
jgi:hypothetical protein